MSSDGFISIRNVGKSFGSFRAIDSISMDIQQGEFFSLLGASGCGKTTLLRMLAGFETPSQGEIFIDGQPMSDVPPFERPVNMVFQNYAIFPHLNVRDNIAYGLEVRGMGKVKRTEKAEEILDLGEADLADDNAEMFGPPVDGRADSIDHDENDDFDEPLINAGGSASMRDNFAALAMLAQPGAAPQIVRSGETSLEGLTRELLRPMLAQWLDDNLPPMVEKMVQAEIARLAGKRS